MTSTQLGAMMTDQKTQMREGFEAQRKAGQNVDWFTWQIAWHDAFFAVHDIVGGCELLSASKPAAVPLLVCSETIREAILRRESHAIGIACGLASLAKSTAPNIFESITSAPAQTRALTDDQRYALEVAIGIVKRNHPDSHHRTLNGLQSLLAPQANGGDHV